MAAACETPGGLAPGAPILGGQSLTWATKVISDGFVFAVHEGLDPTIDGRLNRSTTFDWRLMSNAMVGRSRFGSNTQITYWVSGFLPRVFELARRPKTPEAVAKWKHERFHLFLNHRELLYAVSLILDIPIAFPGFPVGVLPAGSSLLFEVYEVPGQDEVCLHFVWWTPSQPDPKELHKRLHKRKHVLSLYALGDTAPAVPAVCRAHGGYCPLSLVENAFSLWVAETGTYREICRPNLQPNLEPERTLEANPSTGSGFDLDAAAVPVPLAGFGTTGWALLCALCACGLLVAVVSRVHHRTEDDRRTPLLDARF